MKGMVWEGKNSIVTLESDYPREVFGAPKYYCWYLKRFGTPKLLFVFGSLDELVTEAKRWAHNPRVWKLIKEDVYEFMKWRYGREVTIKPSVEATIEEALSELEEMGYRAERYSPYKKYEAGAILPDGRIVEIDGDDHTILDSLPNKITYRFIKDNLYFRLPLHPTTIQIETAIRISPPRFTFVAIDVVDGFDLIKSITKEYVTGTKIDLRKLFYSI